MPGSAGKLVFGTVEDLLRKPRGGVLSFGFLLAIWFSSNGMISMMAGLEKDYETVGFVQNVAFPCATLQDSATGRIAIYYGGADTVTGLAFAKVNEVLDFVKSTSEL